ncbi:MAG: lamin tail domain-containing protein [Myxococcales bacterium]|nr:lamin tail domain-containing protein [Myxococcales bacterium]
MGRLPPFALGLTLTACSVLAAPDAGRLGTGGGGGDSEGGGGGAQACSAAEECPEPESTCQARACVDDVCTVVALPSGTVLGTQAAGDCAINVCDGSGNTTTVADDDDLPEDGSECTDDLCTDGVPSNPPLSAGTPCGDGLSCDGEGQCVGCESPTECPGLDDACQARTCEAGVCGLDLTAAGTPTPTQTAGDCREVRCDGRGGTTDAVLDTDVPVDQNDCTLEGCDDGTPTSTNAIPGATCDDGGTVCNGSGACVACNAPADCGTTTTCRTFSCNAGTCSSADTGAGTPCTEGGGLKCDGSGACVACLSGPDCPSGVCQGNTCVAATCTDLARNGDETDVDCGGSCAPCGLGDDCLVPGDCETGHCQATCQPVIVLGTSPLNGAVNAPVGAPIQITFSGAMTPSTLTAKTSLDSGPCTGSVQVSTDGFATCLPMTSALASMSADDKTASFTPAPGLAFGSTFQIRVTTAAQDAQGAPMASAFTTPQGFTTRYGVTGADVVISQVYGGGGSPGAPYSHDFVELHNRSAGPVGLAGWSLQHASAGGATWSLTHLSGTIPAGGYYLVQLASGGGSGAALPAADAVGLSNLSATAGKVALVTTDTPLLGACPASLAIVDLVGYGAASCSEASPVPALSVTTSATRAGASCVDSGDNAADFGVAAPAPRNGATAPALCTIPVANETSLSYEADSCRVVSPGSLALTAGQLSPAITGEVLEAGITEPPGLDAGVLAQVGYGPLTANPQHQAGWVWTDAAFDAQVGDADQLVGSFIAPAAGAYRFAFRVSVDGGATWTYCDSDGAGSAPGAAFEPPHLPVLTTN